MYTDVTTCVVQIVECNMKQESSFIYTQKVELEKFKFVFFFIIAFYTFPIDLFGDFFFCFL